MNGANNPIEKALTKPTLGNAIRGYCYWCMNGDISDTNTKQSVCAEVRLCTSIDCPLWAVRPWRQSEQVKDDLKHAAENVTKRGYEPKPDTVYMKAFSKPGWRRPCIDAKCWDCTGGGADSGGMRLARDCGGSDCPLYAVRPGRKIKGKGQYQVINPESPEPI